MIIIENARKILQLEENAYICKRRKKQKGAIMKKMPDREKKKNFRITIIFKDEVIVEKFYREDIAIKTVKSMKELFPGMFIGGAVEEMKGRWKVIWTSDSIKKDVTDQKDNQNEAGRSIIHYI